MSWKPSRSSGITFDKYATKSDKHLNDYARMLNSNEYLHMDKLNVFSKHLYLHWLNENKKHYALGGGTFNPERPWRTLSDCARFPFVIPMLERNKDNIYAPLANLLKNEN